MKPALLTTTINEGESASRGKVRDIYVAGEALILVATDRVSAFDCVLRTGIPGRGLILTQLSNFWFRYFAGRVPNHLLATEIDDFPEPYRNHEELRGRSVLVQRLKPIDVECVVRGYLSGSGWKEYQESGEVCGIRLPSGLVESEKLPEPIFTPAAKNRDGHDENISYERMLEITGPEIGAKLRELSLEIYGEAARYAAERGIIIADTKFEFGLNDDGEIVWMDEALTPDSSRFWPLDSYRAGTAQASYDKQFIRDWLRDCGWDFEPPAPSLPDTIVQGTVDRYLEAYRALTQQDISL